MDHCYSQPWTEAPFIWQQFWKPNGSSSSLTSSTLSSAIPTSPSTSSDLLFHHHHMGSAAVTNCLSTWHLLGSCGFCFLPFSCVFCFSPPYFWLMLLCVFHLKPLEKDQGQLPWSHMKQFHWAYIATSRSPSGPLPAYSRLPLDQVWLLV